MPTLKDTPTRPAEPVAEDGAKPAEDSDAETADDGSVKGQCVDVDKIVQWLLPEQCSAEIRDFCGCLYSMHSHISQNLQTSTAFEILHSCT